MDTSKLFAGLVNRPDAAAGGIITGTAVTDSVDGSVMVQLDGSTVAQPSEDEEALTISADAFADGAYSLPSVPYAGTLKITDSNNVELEEEEYELDGNQLTIWALSSSPVEIAYQTNVRQALTNADFDGDDYAVESTDNLQLLEEVSAGDWQPATYTLTDNIITVAGIGHTTGIVEFAYTYSVSQVCGIGDNVLPNAPESVTVYGRNSSGVDVPFAGYTLAGDVITLPADYDVYTVNYDVDMVEAWNVSEQFEDVPLEDSDDSADPVIVTVGHNLQWVPDTVTSCTIDGVAVTYTLDGLNVVADSPTVTERFFTLTYDAPVSLEVPASMFATGAFTLPSIPLGAVTTTMAGAVLANTCTDDQLSIPSLVTSSPSYSITYTAQVEQDTLELPCTPYVAAGQFVEIAVVNGMPTVIGASGSGDVTMTIAGDAAAAATAAEAAATAAQAVADAVNQHFWQRANNPDGAGAGVFITEVPQEDFTDPASPNYQSGANQLSNSAGILLRDGLTNFAQLTPGETAFYDGTGNNASNVVATFGTSGSVIGKAAESHAFIDYHSMQMVDKESNTYFYASDLRDLSGYADVVEKFVGDGINIYFTVQLLPESDATSDVEVNGSSVAFSRIASTYYLVSAPADGASVVISYRTSDYMAKAYTLGLRKYASDVGAMSVAEGKRTEASGFASHAEGDSTEASGSWSHAEGERTVASGDYSHAEGANTKATDLWAHAEGRSTIASGWMSHAQNQGTIAQGTAQTALGRFNVADSGGNLAVIVGNGSSDNDRSNALTVDWDGNMLSTNLGRAAYTDSLSVLTVPGIYYCTTASTDGPVASTAGQCVVAANASQANVVQVFTTFGSTPAVYARRYNSGVWDAWHLVGSEVTTSSPTLTNASATTFQLRKDGSTVNLMVYGLNVSSSLSNGSSVSLGSGIVPADYRPSTYVYAPCVVNNSTNATGLFFYITSGGNVSLYNRSGSSLGTTTNVNCTISWVV